jgi:hypothetical protein
VAPFVIIIYGVTLRFVKKQLEVGSVYRDRRDKKYGDTTD